MGPWDPNRQVRTNPRYDRDAITRLPRPGMIWDGLRGHPETLRFFSSEKRWEIPGPIESYCCFFWGKRSNVEELWIR